MNWVGQASKHDLRGTLQMLRPERKKRPSAELRNSLLPNLARLKNIGRPTRIQPSGRVEHRASFATGEGTPQMLTGAQQHAVDRFTKSLLTLSDDALIDTYHQASEDHRVAQAEGSDNLVSAYTRMLTSGTAMRDRFPDYQRRYKLRYP